MRIELGTGMFGGGIAAPLALAPSTLNRMSNSGAQSTHTYAASGGSGSYTYSLAVNNSGGSIDSSSGLYTCGTIELGNQVDTVRVTDTWGSHVDVTVTVYPKLAIYNGSLSPAAAGQYTFTPGGGSATGYVWSINTATNSTINPSTGFYWAGDVPTSVDNITLTDSLGFQVIVDATIGVFRGEAIGTPIAIYDTRYGTTIVGGSKISAWVDQSGTGDSNKNLAQATSANQPVWTASNANYNNQASISCTTADRWLQGAGLWASAQAQPFTVYVVGQISSGVIVDMVNSQILQYGPNWAYFAGAAFKQGTTYTTRNIVAVVFDGASSAQYGNGDMTTPAVSGDAGSGSATRVSVGATGSGGSNYEVCAIFVYSGHHDATTRGRIRTQLHNLFGVP